MCHNQFWGIFLIFIGSLLFNCTQNHSEINPHQEPQIQRYGSMIGLKPEYEERYLILHKHAFPGVLDRIRKCNIRNYSIFLKDGILFAHFEYVGSDFDKDMADMADEITRDWWKLTDPMQEPLENRKPGEWWASMDLLYQMNRKISNPVNVQRLAFVAMLKADHRQALTGRLQQIDETMALLMLKQNFQNLTVYAKDNRLCFYLEYTGNSYETDWEELFQNAQFQHLYSDVKPLLVSVSATCIWEEMQEVFHTD